METIEKRAKNMELWFLRRMPQFRGYRLSKMFEDMLNEQKAIDIDKACEWLYDWNQKQAKMYGAKATLSVTEYTIDVNDFRKAMEE